MSVSQFPNRTLQYLENDPNSISQVRKGRSYIYQQDIVDVLDKQLLEGMGVLLTEEEQQKCEQSVRIDILCTIYLKSYYTIELEGP